MHMANIFIPWLQRDGKFDKLNQSKIQGFKFRLQIYFI